MKYVWRQEIRSLGAAFPVLLNETARNTPDSAPSTVSGRQLPYFHETARNTIGNMKSAVWRRRFSYLNEIARETTGKLKSPVWRWRLSYFPVKSCETPPTPRNPQSGGGNSRISRWNCVGFRGQREIHSLGTHFSYISMTSRAV